MFKSSSISNSRRVERGETAVSQPSSPVVHFLLQAAGFLLLGFLLLNFVVAPLFIASPFIAKDEWWGRVYQITQRSQQPIPGQAALLGDSVAGQIFPVEQHPNAFPTNGSTLMLGHYILAANIIENNPQVDQIILATVPTAIGNNFERQQTYNNVIKPFYTFENRRHFSPDVLTAISEKPAAHLGILPLVKVASFVSDVDFAAETQKPAYVLSELSIDYLKRLESLAVANNVTLTLVSPPIPSRWLEESSDWEMMRQQVIDNDLELLFDGYFESIIYLDEENFSDHVHLKWNYIAQNETELQQHLFPYTP